MDHEEEMRATPLTLAHFKALSRSAHMFWQHPLDSQCHPDAGVHAVLYSGGNVEMHCARCKTLVGVLALARDAEKAPPLATPNAEHAARQEYGDAAPDPRAVAAFDPAAPVDVVASLERAELERERAAPEASRAETGLGHRERCAFVKSGKAACNCGYVSDAPPDEKCGGCNGSGRVAAESQSFPGVMGTERCGACKGTGKLPGRFDAKPEPEPNWPIGAIRVTSRGYLGVVEQDGEGRYIRWGTCSGCPRNPEGKALPWQCDFYERHDHKLQERAPVSRFDAKPDAWDEVTKLADMVADRAPVIARKLSAIADAQRRSKATPEVFPAELHDAVRRVEGVAEGRFGTLATNDQEAVGLVLRELKRLRRPDASIAKQVGDVIDEYADRKTSRDNAIDRIARIVGWTVEWSRESAPLATPNARPEASSDAASEGCHVSPGTQLSPCERGTPNCGVEHCDAELRTELDELDKLRKAAEEEDRTRKRTDSHGGPDRRRWELHALSAIPVLIEELRKLRHPPKKVHAEAGRCKCGLHEIPAHANVVSWYWQQHARDICVVELPNEKCWCGRLRSEHTDGHDETKRAAHNAKKEGRAPASCPHGEGVYRCDDSDECANKVARAAQPCVTPNGRTDGHMQYIKSMNGVLVCSFCEQPEKKPLTYLCVGGVEGCTNSAASSGPCASCVALFAEAERQRLYRVESAARAVVRGRIPAVSAELEGSTWKHSRVSDSLLDALRVALEARDKNSGAMPSPVKTDREMWLTTPAGSFGRKNIQVEQYEELRALACRALGLAFQSHLEVVAEDRAAHETGEGDSSG